MKYASLRSRYRLWWARRVLTRLSIYWLCCHSTRANCVVYGICSSTKDPEPKEHSDSKRKEFTGLLSVPLLTRLLRATMEADTWKGKYTYLQSRNCKVRSAAMSECMALLCTTVISWAVYCLDEAPQAEGALRFEAQGIHRPAFCPAVHSSPPGEAATWKEKYTDLQSRDCKIPPP